MVYWCLGSQTVGFCSVAALLILQDGCTDCHLTGILLGWLGVLAARITVIPCHRLSWAWQLQLVTIKLVAQY